MAQLAIDILWLLIGALILAGVVWLVIYGINKFIYTLPLVVVQGIWFIVLLLVIIAAITILMGGGGRIRGPSFWGRGVSLPSDWGHYTVATDYLSWLLM